MISNCTVENFIMNYKSILYGFVLVVIAVLCSYPISKLFVDRSNDSFCEVYKRNIYKYALTFGNFGFIGNYVILGVWGSEAFFRYSMFTLPINFFAYSWGYYILLPKKHVTIFDFKTLFKGLVNPTMIATMFGMFLGLLNVKRFIPDFMFTVFSKSGECMGPTGMLLAGVVVSKYNIKDLLCNKKVYFLTVLRLLIIPSVFLAGLLLLNFEKEILLFVLVAFAAPIGLNTVVFPAAFGGDTKTGASMAMISHTISVITIPIMYLLFIVLI